MFFNSNFFLKKDFKHNSFFFNKLVLLKKKIKLLKKLKKSYKVKGYFLVRRRKLASFEFVPYLKKKVSSIFFKKCKICANTVFLHDFFKKKKEENFFLKKKNIKKLKKFFYFYRKKIKYPLKFNKKFNKKKIILFNNSNLNVFKKNFLPFFF